LKLFLNDKTENKIKVALNFLKVTDLKKKE